jgi:hypothetical protein
VLLVLVLGVVGLWVVEAVGVPTAVVVVRVAWGVLERVLLLTARLGLLAGLADVVVEALQALLELVTRALELMFRVGRRTLLHALTSCPDLAA